MMLHPASASALLLISMIHTCLSFHVLFFHNLGTRSHLIQMSPLIQELLHRGHKVTSILYGPVNIQHENFTEILIPNYAETYMEKSSKMAMKGDGQNLFSWLWNLMGKILFFYEIYNDSDLLKQEVATGMFKVEGVKILLENKPQIDAVITPMSFGAIFGDIFDCPLIQFCPAGPVPFMMIGSGNKINLSVQPYMNAPFIEPMTFLQRIQNHMIDMMYMGFFYSITHSITQHQIEYFGRHISHPQEIMEQRVSLVIACSHYITHGAWPYLPNVIEVGGLQLRKGKPLPDDLQKFMESSPGGVVFVSFGSTLKPDQMSEEKKAVFIETFKRLEMSIIWKWDVQISYLPNNVYQSSWLPQQDLLAHPNLKVFVTHGGLGSLVEAIYHKATIVGIPLSNDQKPNLLRAKRHGYAKMLDWDSLNVADLTAAIKSAMLDQDMKKSMEKVNLLYVDREVGPREKAAWWIEYVCRHKGANWLKPVIEKVPWYQFHHVDILIFFSTILIIFFSVTITIFLKMLL